MDSFLPNIGKMLLGVLAATFLLTVVVIALIYVEDVTAAVNRDREAARFQQEYASLRRFQGNEIAYTEVLNAVYILSTPERPVIIATNEWFAANNLGPVGAGLIRFPLPVQELRNNFFGGVHPIPVPSTVNSMFGATHFGIWDGVHSGGRKPV